MAFTQNLILKFKKPSTLLRITYFLVGILIGSSFGVYLWTLYNQLTTVFGQQSQFIPTRIYSDVSRITSPQPRSQIEQKLKTLGYTYQNLGDKLQFPLHPVDYPTYLIPNNHPLLEGKDPQVQLHFDGTTESSALRSIELNQREVPDLYLEPELVATLSHSGDSKKIIRTPLKFSEIPSQVWKAIIAIEDQHFLEHKGLDPRGMARAVWVNLRTFSFAQGGSTITQQLVKNLMARRTKNIFRKVNELFLSLLLEATYDKEQILERYLNEVYLGQVGSLEIHGVAEGAEHFFGKKLEDLNLAEITLMAGLIRGPGYYSPYRYRERALERQRLVLRKLVETGYIANGEAEAAAQLPIRLAPPQTSSNKAPFFVDYVKAELIRQLKDRLSEPEIISSGFRVYTTLDTRLNNFAQSAVTEGISQLETRLKVSPEERLEGALASVDQSSGYVRALVGGKSYSQSTFNRILNMKRQVGSTFKPFVYLTSFLKGVDSQGVPYGPAYPAEDAPWTLTYDRNKQSWSPKNYEKGYRGWVSFRTALAHSINIIAAKLGYEVGIENIIQTARSLGIESSLPSVPSLSLGVAELSPIELLKAYATIANRGIQEELTVLRGITQTDGTGYARFFSHPQPVMNESSTDLLTEMLQSVFIEGTAREASRMGFDQPAAGKTGTTSNHRDAWFAGYTPQLTTVVWVGMDHSSNKTPGTVHLTGGGSALPIWVSFMKAGLQGVPITPFLVSPNLVELKIDRHSGKTAKSDCPPSQVLVEKYIKGHEPRDESCEETWPTSREEKGQN
jgi:penicillin-binding protein 1B